VRLEITRFAQGFRARGLAEFSASRNWPSTRVEVAFAAQKKRPSLWPPRDL
jgi:hypothetical protein